MIDPQRILAELEKIREGAEGPHIDTTDWDRLISLLQVIHCDHKFVVKRQGGPPDDACSNEAVKFCEVCGYEPVDE